MASPRSATTRAGGRNGRDGGSPPPVVVSKTDTPASLGDNAIIATVTHTNCVLAARDDGGL